MPREQGGPFGWTALFHLAASRVPQRDPVATARLLLDAGADPNAGYLWLGLPTPFTVLTLCFGEGEAGPGRQPRHPAGEELAGLLLVRGADPNDAQTLYNRMFGRDDGHLRILLAAGLGHGDGGTVAPPPRRGAGGPGGDGAAPGRLGAGPRLHRAPRTAGRPWVHRGPAGGFAVTVAARGDRSRRSPLRALPTGCGHWLPRAVTSMRRFDGHTLLHHAAWIGDVELVEALLECGADPDVVDAEHGTTPLGWAEHGHAEATAAMLQRLRRRT